MCKFWWYTINFNRRVLSYWSVFATTVLGIGCVVHLVRSSRSYAHIIYQNICVKLVCDVIFLLREAD
jgi:hypothetical protein